MNLTYAIIHMAFTRWLKIFESQLPSKNESVLKVLHITIFTTKMYVKKCSSSSRCQDLNPRPLEHKSPPITTRPGLPP